jgi:hypothetical protein
MVLEVSFSEMEDNQRISETNIRFRLHENHLLIFRLCCMKVEDT